MVRQKNKVSNALMHVPLPVLKQVANLTETRRVSAVDHDGEDDVQEDMVEQPRTDTAQEQDAHQVGCVATGVSHCV